MYVGIAKNLRLCRDCVLAAAVQVLTTADPRLASLEQENAKLKQELEATRGQVKAEIGAQLAGILGSSASSDITFPLPEVLPLGVSDDKR